MRRQHLAKKPELLAILLLLLFCFTQSEIAHSSLTNNRISQEPLESSQVSQVLTSSCPQRLAYEKMLNSIDDVEDLYVDVPVHIALEHRQKKR